MNILNRIRKSYITKGLALTLALNIIGEIIWPTAAMALTSGPTQPEFQSFEPVETTDMVNLFTGDFSYNIPLMNVPGPNGGYPINLSYHANPSMDEEASWVGLGWSINAGAINRNVRGLPDDFNGDTITTKTDMKENWTAGLGVTPGWEIFGADAAKADPIGLFKLGLNFRYNSYKGFGFSVDPGLELGSSSMKYSVGLSLDSEDGVGVNADVSLKKKDKLGSDSRNYEVRNYWGAGFNSKTGLNISTSRSVTQKYMERIPKLINPKSGNVIQESMYLDVSPASLHANITGGGTVQSSASLYFSETSHFQSTSLPLNSYRLNVNLGFGSSNFGRFDKVSWSGNFDIEDLKNKGEDVIHQAFGYEYMYDVNDYIDIENVINDFSRTKQGDVRKTSANLAVPQLTNDVYNILGQGIGGSFRAYRSEIGRIFDPNEISLILGGYFGLDLGTNKGGWGMGSTTGYSQQLAWDKHHELDGLSFSKRSNLWDQLLDPELKYEKKEKVYYKISGEKATLNQDELDHIGGEQAVKSNIVNHGVINNFGVEWTDPTIGITNEKEDYGRIPRNNLVSKVTNREILGYHPEATSLSPGYSEAYPGHSFLGEYEIFHYDWSVDLNLNEDPEVHLERTTRNGSSIKDQHGGYKVLDETGGTYVYGLPVYNNKEIEKVFSINSTEPNVLGGETEIFRNKRAIVPYEIEFGDDEDSEEDDEVIYKDTNTHNFYNRKETPPYATSYLLTSILGADYIDLDRNGPSQGDQGYWVKMDYVKYASNYRWRAPYKGAIYSSGSEATLEDDVASYNYGEKEMWYMSRIETETHIAIFELEEDRSDNYEAIKEFANTNDIITPVPMRNGLRLSKIKLYEKRAFENDPGSAVPIQTVHFDHTYQLCKNAPNHSDSRGKLTLVGLHITYGGNSRGSMNPYKFRYSENNPDYSFEHYDRWGNYKGEPSTVLGIATDEINQELPYTGQYQQGAWGYDPVSGVPITLNQANRNEFQEQQNNNAAAWSLSEITLPSGGTIVVDYEADDYGYVQNYKATQMTYITGVNDNTENRNQLYRWNKSEIENDFADPRQRRIYFKLEKPIPTGASEEVLSNLVYDSYASGLRSDEGNNKNLYFKTFIQLKDAAWDYVSGYLPLEKNELLSWIKKDGSVGIPAYTYGAATPDLIDGVMSYTEGFVTIKPSYKKNDPTNDLYHEFHPISLAVWQYIRINAPQIMADAGDFGEDEMIHENLDTNKKKAKKVKNMFSFLPEIAKIATGYRRYCYQREMARVLLLNKSMIRLTSPDRKKFGGGSRVKQIVMSDNWSAFEETESAENYGVVYDYTTNDPITGEVYSSGVAQYEPMIGGDEIAMRYPKYYPGKIPFFTDNNLFFEHPVNESYMPAPIVGYSKVTVRSLNTANQMNLKDDDLLSEEEEGRGVTGAQVYEFYTARDYPVLVEETPMGTENNTIKSFNLPLIIPFIAEYRRNKIAATQGYKIELNDMHGKLKSTASYGLDENLNLLPECLARTTYKYSDFEASDDGLPDGENSILILNNLVSTIGKDPETGGIVESTKHVGTEYEFFTDQRHNKHAILTVGLDFNLDFVMVPLIGKVSLPSFWGQLSSSKNDVRTFTTNKIILKSGLLEEVTTENENYISTIQTVAYDNISGRPLLTKTQNEYKEDIYNFTHPAHWEYDGMEHAYQNIDLEFYAELEKISTGALFGGSVPSEIVNDLVPGDEFIARLLPAGSTDVNGYKNFRATFISKDYNGGTSDVIIHISNVTHKITGVPNLYDEGVKGYFKVYRSGHRNHFMTDAGSIIAKVNPTDESIIPDPEIHHYHAITGEEMPASSETISLSVRKLSEKVLGSNAVTFKDNWEIEMGSNENPYQIGQAGIWRPVKSYVYAGERSQSSDGTGKAPRVKEDGLMSDVPFFNWQVADYERFQSKWEWSGEVTRLNKFGYETENKDRLGIYSAALYGYNQAFPIGVGANATYGELATQDFEMSSLGSSEGSEAVNLEKECNFYFHTNTGATGTRNVQHSDQFKIVGGKVGVDNFIYIEEEHDPAYWSDVDYIDLAVHSSNESNLQNYRMLRAKITSTSAVVVPGCAVCPYTKVSLEFEHETILPTEAVRYLQNSSHLGGMATVYRTVEVAPIQAGAEAVATIVAKGHTGRKSLKIENGYVGFVHGKLELIPGKRYVVSYWAKRDNTNVFDYNLGASGLRIFVAGTTDDLVISSETKASKVINGWQKIDVEFEIDPGLYDHKQAIETRFYPGASALYVDDVRLSPKTGGIVTYVYNPDNYKLVATLNANNYASFYYYSDQGNLYLVKQETEKGIVTSGGSHGYMRPNTGE